MKRMSCRVRILDYIKKVARVWVSADKLVEQVSFSRAKVKSNKIAVLIESIAWGTYEPSGEDFARSTLIPVPMQEFLASSVQSRRP